MNNEYEESIKKEFAEREGITEVTTDNKVTDLGQVDSHRMRRVDPDDPEVKRLNELVGYIKLDLGLLPSGGRFYREDFEIHIRAARVGEIRDFSTMEDENPKDVDEKLNNIIVQCSRIMYGTQRGSYKDILEEDRIYVILSIRELTFKEGEHKLLMPVKSKSCTMSSCKSQDQVELKTNGLQFEHPDHSLDKYYDPVTRSYAIETKNYGIIHMAPPTIGVMRALTDYIRKKEETGQPWDKSSMAIIPYIQREWRGCGDREIFSTITNLQGWDSMKYSLTYRLAEKMKVGVKPEFVYPCESCGAEITVPLSFPGGIKSIFVIQDISAELL
jgi:hypothetical protein